ncbi:hypothetical protein [Peptostreptococcus faecalis]|uniref:hypothetical protein n=1 Tax=Peptostreptococcus faecalis TaxID=2045015 RepID=UPI000C7CA58D|nr:hypothetical protein [Peptostreptococcus faecalis]
MLRLDEKVIFKMKSGYSLNGLNDFILEDKSLQLTNLGNIYISKVDCLQEENTDYLVYDYLEHGRNLYSELDSENINIVSESIPFTRVKNGVEEKVYADLIFILDLDEFAFINNQIKNMIFDFRKGDILLTADGKVTIGGKIEKAEKRLIFDSGKNRFEYRFEDVESFSMSENRITLKGYFYIDKESIIMREVSFVGSIGKNTLPDDFESIVKSNKKIGKLPKKNPIVFCKVSGRVRGNDYLLKNMFFIKHDDLYVLYEKKQKEEVICREISSFSSFYLGNENYVVYDGIDVYNMYINESNAKLIDFDKLKAIDNKMVGFTKELRPFFLEITEEKIKIHKSKEKVVLEIDKSQISDVSINEENSIDSEYFVETKIKFKDKFVILNLRREIINDLSSNIFSDYQNSLLEETSKEEVYYNWIKSVSDMVIFNFFGQIYEINSKLLILNEDELTTEEWVKFVNQAYTELQDKLKKLDLISVYMSEILENNEIRYFKSIGIEFDDRRIENLERLFFEIRNDLKLDINEILRTIESASFMLLPDNMRKYEVKKFKETQVYRANLFGKQTYSKMKHLIYNLLPHYISKTVKEVFGVYVGMAVEYNKVDENELKKELMDRIRSAHLFKQFTISKESSVLRKDIIDDLYSLTKFSSMKIDSEYYYTGGYTHR